MSLSLPMYTWYGPEPVYQPKIEPSCASDASQTPSALLYIFTEYTFILAYPAFALVPLGLAPIAITVLLVGAPIVPDCVLEAANFPFIYSFKVVPSYVPVILVFSPTVIALLAAIVTYPVPLTYTSNLGTPEERNNPTPPDSQFPKIFADPDCIDFASITASNVTLFVKLTVPTFTQSSVPSSDKYSPDQVAPLTVPSLVPVKSFHVVAELLYPLPVLFVAS